MRTEKQRAHAKKHYEANKERILQKQKDYIARNAERVKDTRRRYYQENKDKWRNGYHAKHTGFSEGDVSRLILIQGNRCAICETVFESRAKIAADHCHKDKVPRGLLCRRCNLIEGQIAKTGLSYEDFGARLAHYVRDPPFSKLDP